MNEKDRLKERDSRESESESEAEREKKETERVQVLRNKKVIWKENQSCIGISDYQVDLSCA
jgi:hypothetical protein